MIIQGHKPKIYTFLYMYIIQEYRTKICICCIIFAYNIGTYTKDLHMLYNNCIQYRDIHPVLKLYHMKLARMNHCTRNAMIASVFLLPSLNGKVSIIMEYNNSLLLNKND